jgi:phosphoribosylamine--glycine ligase
MSASTDPAVPCAPEVPARVNVLLVGTGGRESALAWKLRQSPRLGTLWVQPDANAQLLELGTPCPEKIDFRAKFHLERWLDRNDVQLVVVGPEGPLADGVVDALTREADPAKGIAPRLVFGPVKAAARLEGDKAYAKQVMREARVPTAESRTFTSLESAIRSVEDRDEPCVVKATGLCAGKGVTVCDSGADAISALRRCMDRKEFGDAGATVLIEERLEGQELSVLALVDGHTVTVLDPCQDHKQVGEGDVGANTGGMGAYCPTPLADDELIRAVSRDVLVPTIDALHRDGITFRGVLYAGLMLTPSGPKVLEFNTRFGDPETQPLMARLQGDLVEILWRTAAGTLDGADVGFDPRVACGVVVCSGGYPGRVTSGLPIDGLDQAAQVAGPGEDIVLFHAGTRRADDGQILTNGGRVITVVGLAPDLAAAQAVANRAAACIRFPGAFFRTDIGHRVMRAPAAP